MKYTKNFNLNKPDISDQYNIEHFNDNADTLDTTIQKEINDRKADTTSLTAKITAESTSRASDIVEAKKMSNMTGVATIAQGGTGKTTAQEALEALSASIGVIGGKSEINNDDRLLFKRSSNVKSMKFSDLQDNIIDTVNTNLTPSTIARKLEVTAVENKVTAEVTAREKAIVEAKKMSNMTGVATVAQGGTGKTTQQAALEELCSNIEYLASDDDINNNDEILFKRSTNVKGFAVSDLGDKISQLLDSKFRSMVPIGTVHAFVGSSAPQDYMLCNGAAVSRTTYAALYNLIGTTYGVGDGTTTFNLPNFAGKFLEGKPSDKEVGNNVEAGLPSIDHTHSYYTATSKNGYGLTGGSAEWVGIQLFSGSGDRTFWKGADTNATTGTNSAVNGIYGKSTTVQPPAVCVNYIIKVK